jgi:hypothetical protein
MPKAFFRLPTRYAIAKQTLRYRERVGVFATTDYALQANPQYSAELPVAPTLVVAEFVRGVLAPYDYQGK